MEDPCRSALESPGTCIPTGPVPAPGDGQEEGQGMCLPYLDITHSPATSGTPPVGDKPPTQPSQDQDSPLSARSDHNPSSPERHREVGESEEAGQEGEGAGSPLGSLPPEGGPSCPSRCPPEGTEDGAGSVSEGGRRWQVVRHLSLEGHCPDDGVGHSEVLRVTSMECEGEVQSRHLNDQRYSLRKGLRIQRASRSLSLTLAQRIPYFFHSVSSLQTADLLELVACSHSRRLIDHHRVHLPSPAPTTTSPQQICGNNLEYLAPVDTPGCGQQVPAPDPPHSPPYPAEQPSTPAEAGREVPAEEGEFPADGKEIPVEGGEVLGSGGKVGAEGEVPAHDGREPAEGDKIPAEGAEIPTEEEQIPAEGEEFSAEGGKNPPEIAEILTEEEIPVEGEKIPVEGVKIHGEEFSEERGEIPGEKEISVEIGMPQAGEKIPADRGKISMEEEIPVETGEIPPERGEVPTEGEEIPAGEECPAGGELPVEQGEAPAEGEEAPAGTGPPAAGRKGPGGGKKDPDEELYNIILLHQSARSRIEEQRSQPPARSPREFFDLLERLQVRRMDEQRAAPPPGLGPHDRSLSPPLDERRPSIFLPLRKGMSQRRANSN